MSTVPSPFHTRLRMGDPAQIVAALPALLGFHPARSLVALLLGQDNQLRTAARADLPEPDDLDVAAARLAATLIHVGGGAVILVVVDDADPTGRAEFVGVLADMLARGGLRVPVSVWATGTELGGSCGLLDEPGRVWDTLDPAASAATAAIAANGGVVHASREQVLAILAPVGAAVLRAHTAALQNRVEDGAAVDTVAVMTSAVADQLAHPRGLITLEPRRAAELGLAFADPTATDVWAPMLLDERAHPIELLATHLTRVLPASHRGGAAIVVALTAYLRGDGVLATAALDIARDTTPERPLTGLLTRAMTVNIDPRALKDLLATAVLTAG